MVLDKVGLGASRCSGVLRTLTQCCQSVDLRSSGFWNIEFFEVFHKFRHNIVDISASVIKKYKNRVLHYNSWCKSFIVNTCWTLCLDGAKLGQWGESPICGTILWTMFHHIMATYHLISSILTLSSSSFPKTLRKTHLTWEAPSVLLRRPFLNIFGIIWDFAKVQEDLSSDHHKWYKNSVPC